MTDNICRFSCHGSKIENKQVFSVYCIKFTEVYFPMALSLGSRAILIVALEGKVLAARP